ncbi:hypothetical protein ACM5B4_004859, partial [Escherichia coli]
LVSSAIILWMLDVEYLPPVRATNSGLENTKKPDYQSGFFVPVVRLFFRFFPSFGGFSFSFFVKSNAAGRVGQQINAVIGVSINPFFQ